MSFKPNQRTYPIAGPAFEIFRNGNGRSYRVGRIRIENPVFFAFKDIAWHIVKGKDFAIIVV